MAWFFGFGIERFLNALPIATSGGLNMVTRLNGARKRSRHKMLKSAREKGKLPFSRYLQSIKVGERVTLKAEPGYQNGMYCLRFHNKIGTVTGKKGKCYEISIKDGGKKKMVIVHPVHLVKAR